MNINTLGGVTWVNLLNTQRISNGVLTDLLEDENLLLSWLKDNGLKNESNVKQQQGDLKKLRNIFLNIMEGNRNNCSITESIEELNRIMKKKPIIWNVSYEDENFNWHNQALDSKNSDSIHIIHSFLQTIEHQGLTRVRQCDHDECILYFLDTSKAGRRRWCNMETCGNKHKAHKHYQKQKGKNRNEESKESK